MKAIHNLRNKFEDNLIVVNHRKTRTFESNSQLGFSRSTTSNVVNHRKTRTFESNSQRACHISLALIVVNHRKTRTFESNSQR